MSSILENPIWNALISGSKAHSMGNERVRYMERDKGIFVGFKTYSQAEWDNLDQWFPEKTQIVLFTSSEITIPGTWNVKINRPLFQMVYESGVFPAIAENPRATPLFRKDVPVMLALTALTNPGPFYDHTIQLGYYEGIFERENLVAMAGQRLQPDPFVEISAVCTHPDFVGKGLAAELVSNQVRSILSASKIPFLHVNSDNYGAIRLYEKLGFRLRKEINVYFLEKAS